jgi:PAS domain S-box-containing protein
MFKLLFSLTLKRASWLIALAGFVSFSASFGLLMVFAFHWTSVAIHTVSETALTVVLAAVISQFTMSVTGALLTRHQGREIEQLRTAIDSMPQGMCMFDHSERLVVCNTQYYEMYGLTSADVIPGSTLSDVLARRVAKGTFSRNPDDYRKEFLAAVALGRTIVHEVKSKDGRLLLVTNHPMKSGGWIGTHEDITERRQTEQQPCSSGKSDEPSSKAQSQYFTIVRRISCDP